MHMEQTIPREPQDQFYVRLKDYIVRCNERDFQKYGFHSKQKWETHVVNHYTFIANVLRKLGLEGDLEAMAHKVLEIDRKKRMVFQYNPALDVDPEARNKGVARARKEFGYGDEDASIHSKAQNGTVEKSLGDNGTKTPQTAEERQERQRRQQEIMAQAYAKETDLPLEEAMNQLGIRIV